ncbi:leiomodin-1-like [Carassius gibelio]|uniref:leiomodin-1-like n=1 Tax=Carassius gibelio TaxID=101364 RepID=UPI0022776D27|nr:leiomodin-1-like [Carassius gibelio]
MSRRKVRGLTKTGRQVSEDPDLDSLLSNLSPEEMEELQKEVSVVPDPDPSEIIVLDQTDFKPTTAPPKRESQQSSQTDDFRSRLKRNLSTEGEPKKESRKQEYLRKMGLSQEKNTSASDSKDGGLQRTPFTSSFSKRDGRMEDRTRRVTEASKDDKFDPYALSRKDEESEKQTEVKEQNNGSKFKDRREMRESSSNKTKELISKLQETKEDSKEKNRKEDCWKRESGESRAKEMISRIKEKEEKERDRKEEFRKREEIKTKGYTSRLEEKQNQVLEDKTKEEKKVNEENQIRRLSEKVKESPMLEVMGQNEIDNEVHESIKQEKIGNCVSDTISKSKTNEEEEEDESASMFDEDLERVRCNDSSMTDLNVNNSEVIKTKTLIQFAEALKNNTHIKVFSLANCRADDHVAYAIAGTLRNNKSIISINLDSNLLTSKGVMALIHALQHNSTLTELRFHNQRHIIGGKSEMEMTKILKENTTLLKLGYHFELAGPRMTMTNILSRNMDRQRQKRLQEQKQAQVTGDKKDTLEVPKPGFGKGSPKASPRPSPITSPVPSPTPSPKLTQKKRVSGLGGGPPPPPPPPGGPPPPPPPMLDGDFLKNSLTPISQRKLDDRKGGRGGAQNSRDQLLASIRGTNIRQLKKVALPKLLQ